jgi:hypothetical protein
MLGGRMGGVWTFLGKDMDGLLSIWTLDFAYARLRARGVVADA